LEWICWLGLASVRRTVFSGRRYADKESLGWLFVTQDVATDGVAVIDRDDDEVADELLDGVGNDNKDDVDDGIYFFSIILGSG
jgi:hypothetical protein